MHTTYIINYDSLRGSEIFNQTKLLLLQFGVGVGSVRFAHGTKYGNAELPGNENNKVSIRDSCFYPDVENSEHTEVIQNPYYGTEDMEVNPVIIVKKVDNPYYIGAK